MYVLHENLPKPSAEPLVYAAGEGCVSPPILFAHYLSCMHLHVCSPAVENKRAHTNEPRGRGERSRRNFVLSDTICLSLSCRGPSLTADWYRTSIHTARVVFYKKQTINSRLTQVIHSLIHSYFVLSLLFFKAILQCVCMCVA